MDSQSRRAVVPIGALLALSLLACACGRIGFDGLDRDAALDIDAALPAAQLDVWPLEIRDPWVEADLPVSYEAIVRETSGISLASLTVTVPEAWASVEVLPETVVGERRLRIVVDAPVGTLSQAIEVSAAGLAVTPVAIELDLAVRQTRRYHVGVTNTGCSRMEGGVVETACDFINTAGVQAAMLAAAAQDTRVLFYDDAGATAVYRACELSIPANTWLSAAPGLSPEKVVFRDFNAETGLDHSLLFDGDGIRMSGFTIEKSGHCGVGNLLATATSGHLIENMIFNGTRPESIGFNTTVSPFALGNNTTVRNSLVTGHFEEITGMANTTGIRLIGNTIIAFDAYSGSIDLAGASDLVFANNLFFSPSRLVDALVATTDSTTNLTITGNVFEGYDTAILGPTPSGAVSDNVFGALDVESPRSPQWLQGAGASTGAAVPGSGTSLDGTPIGGRRDLLPGAFQERSVLGVPRRDVVRVGNGSCGGQACDVDASVDDEIQEAILSSWPGSVVEIYPSASPYAGRAFVTWPLTIRGMGDQPEDVVLEHRTEAVDVSATGKFGGHGAILAFPFGTRNPSRVENLSLRGASGCQALILTEGAGTSSPLADHVFTRLRLETTNLVSTAMHLSDRTRVQDSLITGQFGTCVRYGLPRNSSDRAHVVTTGALVNLTCRLSGVPNSIFDVPAVQGSRFVNLAIELTTPAPLFRAKRRTIDDIGLLAADPPLSFTANSVSVRNRSVDFSDFAATLSHVLTAVDTVTDTDLFFVDPTDSHLQVGAGAMDSGVDPATVGAGLAAGTSLDGVSRAGRTIDRGAYEQGN